MLRAKAAGRLPRAEFALVVSNKANAGGIGIAKAHGVPVAVIENRAFKGDRAGHDRAVIGALGDAGCEAVVLAGYMRVIGPEFVAAYRHRIVNIHPALLPSFPGLHGQAQAIEYGVRITGCTVHFVDEGMDSGPIILQRAVAVEQDDTEETLGARLLVEEHRAIVEGVALLTEERLAVEGRRVRIMTASRSEV